MRFYLALQQMQTDLAHEIWFCLTESVRSFAKIKKADYLFKTEKSAEEASASFYFVVFNIFKVFQF